MRHILLIATILLSALPAMAQSGTTLPSAYAAPPAFTPVKAIQCLFVTHRSGFENMVNRCGECRVAHVSRTRPGSMTITRIVHVPAGKSVQLPFKGRGQTRITSESFCANAKGEDPGQNLQDNAQCLKIKNMQTSGVVIVNLCEKCRTAVIERFDADNTSTQEVMAVKGRAYVPVPAQGAVSARILTEQKCRPGDAG